MNHDEIKAKVADVLEAALGCDEDEIVDDASLTADLGAESIDFLDIVFQLEKTFSTSDTPFKIDQGELFPEGLMDNADWVQDGKLTDDGLAMLAKSMPHVNFDGFDGTVSKVGDLITVGSLVNFVELKLQVAAA
jgi:acyl carrier protein